jgi:homogentisate 1,2-dioxygenase
VGNIPRQRHTQLRAPDGRLYYEELMGEEGFSSDSSLLYHVNIPSTIIDSRIWELSDLSTTPNHPLRPLHFATHALFEGVTDVDGVTGRRLLLGNGDVRLSYVVADKPSPYYRNAIGDECLYVEAGDVVVETVFGDIAAGEGDYVLIPRATTHRIVPNGPVRLYTIEANSHIGPPKQYLSKHGQLLEHAPYCERDFRPPTDPRIVEGANVEVYIKHRGNGPSGVVGTIHVSPHHPFDVIGWDGCLYPFAFNVRDYMPITGKVHQPPPVHQVWEGYNFVVCNFVPRKVDYHPDSIPVPYYHSNVDTRSCSTAAATTRLERAPGSAKVPSACTPAVTRTVRNRPRMRDRSAPSTSTSWPSWWTLSVRWRSEKPAAPRMTASTRIRGRTVIVEKPERPTDD